MTAHDEQGGVEGAAGVGEAFGPYRITRRGPDSPVGARLLAVDDRTSRSVIVHVRSIGRDRKRQRRELAALEACAAVAREGVPHLLAIEGWGLWEPGRLAWVTAYPGTGGGPVTLAGLARAKGGRLPAGEAKRAVEQLWAGVKAAQGLGASQGPVDLEAVLVDPQGRVWIENYGLAGELRAAGSLSGGEGSVRKLEWLSLAASLVELTTGVSPPLPSRVPEVPGLPAAWVSRLSGWSEEALAGVVTAALRAEDAVPGVVEVLRGVVGEAAKVEAAAADAASQAAWSAARGVVKGAVRGAAAAVRNLFRRG